MSEERIIWVATWAAYKGYDYETLSYSDYMNGYSEFVDDVWDYVIELQEIGRLAFYEKYKQYKLY
jgi:hypothetical protein